MSEILGIIGLLMAFPAIWLGVSWVLGPLDRAAKNRQYPIQFSLADFLCLFVQVQLVLAGPSLLFRTIEDRTPAVVVSAILVALALLIWWTGVRTLSRAGVLDTTARAFTLAVIIPFGYASAIAIPIVAVMICPSPVDRPSGMPSIGLLGLVEILLVVFVVGMGFVTRRIIAGADRRRRMPPPAESARRSEQGSE